MTAPLLVKQPQKIWVIISYDTTQKYDITKLKHKNKSSFMEHSYMNIIVQKSNNSTHFKLSIAFAQIVRLC